MQIHLRTLTPLWTGGVDQSCDRVHETGLIGSLRWWYEALVRGLGGYACDPTERGCQFDEEKYRKSRAASERQRLLKAEVCDACQLFGCTGWARKFRLRVLNTDGRLIQDAIQKDTEFVLEFVELRPISLQEKWLLAKAIEIAAKYGALGGKTTLKPQKDQHKGAENGIIRWIKTQPPTPKLTITDYLRRSDFRGSSVKLPDLRWFFFVRGRFLWHSQINALCGLSENGQVVEHEAYQNFLRGRCGDQHNDAVSKKIFSFRADGGRIWGYAQDKTMRDEIVSRIHKELGEETYVVKTGEEVLNEL